MGACTNLLVITHDYGYIYKCLLKLLGPFQPLQETEGKSNSDGELVFLSAYHSNAQLNVIFCFPGYIG